MRLVLTISLAMAIIPLPWPEDDPRPTATGPVFSGAALVRPEGYHTWPLVGASLGLSYAETPQGSGPGAFHRVYVNPSSYEVYDRTGTFPDGTMFVLELYAAHEKTAPAKGGYFEGPRDRSRGVSEGHPPLPVRMGILRVRERCACDGHRVPRGAVPLVPRRPRGP